MHSSQPHQARDSAQAAPRVLAVDDDPAVSLFMRELLEKAGFVVATAENGAQAVARFREFRPDLVLLDIDMPEMDGFAACATMRADGEGPSIPIVMVTGLDDAPSIHRAFEVGATDFISKPINWPLFQYRVEGILAAAQTSQKLAATHQRIDSLQRVAPDTALVVARDGSILERLGAHQNDLAGKNLDDVWPHGIATSMEQCVRHVLKSRQNKRYEFEAGSETSQRAYEAAFLPDGRERVLIIVQEITPTYQAEVYQLAYYDSMTRLPNQHSFERTAEAQLAEATLREQRLAIINLAFDKLDRSTAKLVGSDHDQAAQQVARRLREAVASSDYAVPLDDREDTARVAILSGGHFAVLLSGMAVDGAVAKVADAVRDAFRPPISIGSEQILCRPGIGIALFPGDGRDVHTLLGAARTAASEARAAADTRYFSDAVHVSTLSRLDFAAELRWAIEQEQLELSYQPRIDIKTDEIVAVEALLRWFHPLRGAVPLEELLPLAEATGLILPIGHWVLSAACRQVRTWNERVRRDLRVSVNLSHHEFLRPGLAKELVEIFDETGIEPNHLELELTERTLMRAQHPLAELKQLEKLGVGIVLDDFGTGFSSLAHLKDFPLDGLKIDGAFVHGAPGNGGDSAICEVIVAMAHKFGCKAIAEAVETGEQLELLRRIGCDELQGFLVSRPLPADEVEAFLSESGEDKNRD